MRTINLVWQMSFIILVSFAFITPVSQLTAQDDFEGWYRLKTMFRGEGECLEGNQAGSKVQGGAAFMDKCQNVSGQLWKIEDAGNGYYRLKTMFRGENECLEGNQAANSTPDNITGGGAFMDRCQNVSGQLWKFEKVR